jgi:hypothetical protein
LNCSASNQNGEIVNVCNRFGLKQLAILTAFQVQFLGSFPRFQDFGRNDLPVGSSDNFLPRIVNTSTEPLHPSSSIPADKRIKVEQSFRALRRGES